MLTERQKLTRFLSLLSCLLCIVSVFAAGKIRSRAEGFPLGDLSAFPAEEALAAYEQSGEAEDLVQYLKILCWQASEGSVEAAEAAAKYGTVLLTMAKEGTVNLEQLGEADPQLLDLLQLIRAYGAE